MKPNQILDEVSEEIENLSSLAREPASISKKAGEHIIREHEPAKFMYIVKEGSVDISHEGIPLERVGKAGVIGEMALIDGAPRSATAIAFEDSVLIPVCRERFRHLVQRNPEFAFFVMETMVRRIRQMNVRLEMAKKKPR